MSTTRDRARPPLRRRRSTAAGGVVLRHGEHGPEVALRGIGREEAIGMEFKRQGHDRIDR